MVTRLSAPSAILRIMDENGQARDLRARLARGTASNAATGHDIARSAPITQRSASEEPARTIHEAVERWIVTRESCATR
jgi:hypothetical protein